MTRMQRRAALAGAVAIAALCAPRSASAQNTLGAPMAHEFADRARTEHRLGFRQARLERNAARGDGAAVAQDARQVEKLQYRLTVDNWLIRKNAQCDPGFYPHSLRLDPITCAAIAQYQPPPRPLSRP